MKCSGIKHVEDGPLGNTFKESWQAYKSIVYPKGLHASLELQVQQAFIAGAMEFIWHMQKTSQMPLGVQQDKTAALINDVFGMNDINLLGTPEKGN